MNFAIKRTFFLTVLVSICLIGFVSAQTLPLAELSETVVSGDYGSAQVSGDYLYIASGYGLTIYDISDLTSPELVVNFGTKGEAMDVELLDDYAVVADGYNGLVIVDIADPMNPFMAAELALDGVARSIDISANGMYAVVALEDEGIALVNVSDPLAPVALDVYDTPGRAIDVLYANDYFYVSDQGTLESFSIVGNALVNIDSFTDILFAKGMAYGIGRLVVADEGYGVRFITLTGGGNFGVEIAQYTAYTSAVDVMPMGANFTVALGDEGVAVLSMMGVEIGFFNALFDNASAFSVQTTGNYIYVAERNDGFQILDAAVVSNITEESAVNIAGGPRNSVTYVDGDNRYSFVAYHAGGVKVMDITDPQSPVLVHTIPLDGWCYDVDILGDYLFVVEYWSGVYAYDISNPLLPVAAGDFPIAPVNEDGTRACAAYGDYLFVVHYYDGLYKLDVSTPGSITSAGTYNTDGHPRDVKADEINQVVFIADYDGGVDIIDVSGAPAFISQYTTTNVVRAVDFLDDVLYAGSGDGYIDILDISTLATPTLITTYTTLGDVNGLNVYTTGVHEYVFACDWSRGVEAINVTDPALPTQAGTYDTHSLGKAGFVDNGYFHVSDSYSFYILAIGGLVDVWIPDNLVGEVGGQITIPIYVTDLTGLDVISYETTIGFDPDILAFVDTSLVGTISEGYTVFPNILGPGQLNIGLLNTTSIPLTGEGVLINLIFDIDPGATVGEETDLTFMDFMFNEGMPMANTADGMVTLTAVYQIDGTAAYYAGSNDPVADMTMTLDGPSTLTATTAGTGYYLFDNLSGGTWELNATKLEDDYQPFWVISFADAVMTAMGAIGLLTLTANQETAGDVSGNGSLTYFDASQIAQYAIHSLPTGIHFSASIPEDSDWETVPDDVLFDPLTSSQTQDFEAILFGDVDGNWSAPAVSGLLTNNELMGECIMNGDMVTIPVRVVNNANTAYFFQGEMLYDPELLEFHGFELASNLTGWDGSLFNASVAGHLRFGSFNTSPLSASGDVAYVTFKILDNKIGIDVKLTNYFTHSNASVYSAETLILPDGVPTSYRLAQNFPNPFNPDTNIRFDVKDRGNVSLIIYNALGQKVHTLLDESMNPGAYSRKFNGKDDRGMELSSGLYFYQIKVNDFSDTKKMILVK